MLGSYIVNKFADAADNRPDIIIVEPIDNVGTLNRRWQVFGIEILSKGQTDEYAKIHLSEAFATINTQRGQIQKGIPEGFAGLPIQGTFTWNGIDFS